MELIRKKSFDELNAEERGSFFQMFNKGYENPYMLSRLPITDSINSSYLSFLSDIENFYRLLDKNNSMSTVDKLFNHKEFDKERMGIALRRSVENLIKYVIDNINSYTDTVRISSRIYAKDKSMDIEIFDTDEETEFERQIKKDPGFLREKISYVLAGFYYSLYEIQDFLDMTTINISRTTKIITLEAVVNSNKDIGILRICPTNDTQLIAKSERDTTSSLNDITNI